MLSDRCTDARKGKENLRGGACVGCRSASHPFLISAQITISDELKSHLIEPSDNVEVAEIGPPDMDIEEFSHA